MVHAKPASLPQQAIHGLALCARKYGEILRQINDPFERGDTEENFARAEELACARDSPEKHGLRETLGVRPLQPEGIGAGGLSPMYAADFAEFDVPFGPAAQRTGQVRPPACSPQ